MPSKPELRWCCPIDGLQIATGSASCAPRAAAESAAGHVVRSCDLGDGKGRKVASPALADTPVRTTKVALMAGHPDHGPGHGGYRHRNVKALCHLPHDRPEHRRRIRLPPRRRRAPGDLFPGPCAPR